MRDVRKFLLLPALLALPALTGRADVAAGPVPPPPPPTTTTTTAEPAAPKVDYVALAEAAEKVGDLGNAAGLLEKARRELEVREWRQLTLRLAELRIRLNELEEAEKLLTEMAMLYPVDDAVPRRIVQCRLLLAAGDFEKADELAGELVSGGNLSRAQLGEVMKLQGEARLGRGEYDEAADSFARLERTADTPEREFDARCRRIYALLLAGKFPTGAELLAAAGDRFRTPEQQLALRKLELLRLGFTGDIPNFRRHYAALLPLLPPDRPDYIVKQAARRAAATLQKSGAPADRALATELLRAAFNFAETPEEQKEIIYELVNAAVTAGRPLDAAAAIEQYLKFYPNDPSRSRLLMEAGQLYAAAEKWPEALQSFRKITSEVRLPPEIRLAAAREAAMVALKTGDRAEEDRNLAYLVRHASKPVERQDAYILTGEACFRRGAYARAAEAFAAAAAENSDKSDQAVFWQLQSLIKAENYADALTAAARLRQARAEELRMAGDYFTGMLQEKTGETTKALLSLLKVASDYPGSEYGSAALFHAAGLAGTLKDPTRAARLFMTYAEKYPDQALAPNALFKAAEAAFLVPDDGTMRESTELLAAKYPASEFTVAALFRRVDLLAAESRFRPALETLETIIGLAGDRRPETVARARYDQAELHLRLDDRERARAILTEILEKYVDTGIAADAARLAGELASNDGRYANGAAHYRRAAELRPGGRFAKACSERAADCELSLFSSTRDQKLLESAAEIYTSLIAENDPASLYSSLYKLGRCRELERKPKQALAVYGEAIYRAAAAKQAGREIAPVWIGKSAYAAIQLHLKNSRPDAGREALKLIEVVKSLNLDTGEDFDEIAETIRNRYRI